MRRFAIYFRGDLLHITPQIWQKGACIRALIVWSKWVSRKPAWRALISPKRENRGFVRFSTALD